MGTVSFVGPQLAPIVPCLGFWAMISFQILLKLWFTTDCSKSNVQCGLLQEPSPTTVRPPPPLSNVECITSGLHLSVF